MTLPDPLPNLTPVNPTPSPGAHTGTKTGHPHVRGDPSRATTTEPPATDLTERRLSDAQIKALLALTRGATVTDAAKVAGVSRQSVSTWLHRDPDFRAAYNQLRLDVMSGICDRLRRLAGDSLTVLEQKVAAGDKYAAVAALQALAEIAPASGIGPASADGIREADFHALLGSVLEESALDPHPVGPPPPQVDLPRDDDNDELPY